MGSRHAAHSQKDRSQAGPRAAVMLHRTDPDQQAVSAAPRHPDPRGPPRHVRGDTLQLRRLHIINNNAHLGTEHEGPNFTNKQKLGVGGAVQASAESRPVKPDGRSAQRAASLPAGVVGGAAAPAARG